MKALMALGQSKLEMRDVADPEPGPGQAVIDVSACTICGSDLHDFHAPLETPRVLGHELAGVVAAVGGGVDIAVGTPVAVLPTSACGRCPACLDGTTNLCRDSYASTIGYGLPGGLAERVLVPRAEVGRTLFPLPPGTDPVRGALAEPPAVAVRVVQRSGTPSDRGIVIFGAGPVGLLIALVAHHQGVQCVALVEPREDRRDAATRLALPCYQSAEDPELRALFIDRPFGRQDVVVDAAGASAALAAAVRAVRPGGILLAVAGHDPAPALDLSYLIRKEVSIVSSFAYTAGDYGRGLQLLLDGAVPVSAIVTHRLPLGDSSVFTAATQPGAVKVALTGMGS